MGPEHTVFSRAPRSFGPAVPEDDAEKLLELVAAAATSDSHLLPLPPLPPPPRPKGRSNRIQSRHRKSVRLWKRASELCSILNDAWNGRPSSQGNNNNTPHPQRIRNADVEAHVLRGWSVVLDAAKRLQASRRLSEESDATGVELWARLRKGVMDAYGRPTDGKPTYVSFATKRIKELPPGAPTFSSWRKPHRK